MPPQKGKMRSPNPGFNPHNHAHTSFLSMILIVHLKGELPTEAWEELKNLTDKQIDDVTCVYSWLKECWDAHLIPGLLTIDKTKNGFLDNLPALWKLIIEDVMEGR